MNSRRAAIESIYASVRPPEYAAANLDALADVLRDLSWLPEGPVVIDFRPDPELSEEDRAAIAAVLRHAVTETARSPRPVRLA